MSKFSHVMGRPDIASRSAPPGQTFLMTQKLENLKGCSKESIVETLEHPFLGFIN